MTSKLKHEIIISIYGSFSGFKSVFWIWQLPMHTVIWNSPRKNALNTVKCFVFGSWKTKVWLCHIYTGDYFKCKNLVALMGNHI